MKALNQIFESSLSRIWQWIEKPNSIFAVLAAKRNSEFGDTPKEDEIRYLELHKDILNQKYGLVELEGGYTTVNGEFYREPSFFVPRIGREEALQFALKYDQETFLYKSEEALTVVDTETGKDISAFKIKAGRDNLTFNREELKKAFSALKKGSHRNRAPVVEEIFVLESPSVFKIMGGITDGWPETRKRKPL